MSLLDDIEWHHGPVALLDGKLRDPAPLAVCRLLMPTVLALLLVRKLGDELASGVAASVQLGRGGIRQVLDLVHHVEQRDVELRGVAPRGEGVSNIIAELRQRDLALLVAPLGHDHVEEVDARER
eukprot:scaffold73138_cov48-Phaeocystis_antarctica.AAC.1